MSNEVVFERTVLCPKALAIDLSDAKTAINSICIITAQAWESVLKSLLEQACLRGNMPEYKTCITDMLRANGFYPSDTPIELIPKGVECIVHLKYCGYYALKIGETGEYILRGLRDSVRIHYLPEISAVWKYREGSDNRKAFKKSASSGTIPNDGRGFTGKNVNPEGKLIGDCAVRALCSAYDCKWTEAIDLLARASGYSDPVINSKTNIDLALTRLEFERCRALKIGGRALTGKQFCDMMNCTYKDGERIFAYVGRSHCAAVLPTRAEDGSIAYKIQDTWDSTERCIGDYWIYKKPVSKKAPVSQRKAEPAVGACVKHPQFGEGRIVKIIGSEISRFFEIDFEGYGIKRISEEWLKKFQE